MTKHRGLRIGLILGAIAAISLLHYRTGTHHLWLHQLFQRGYYLPVLLAALWFGLSGGLLAATAAGLFYVPHILLAWGHHPDQSLTQYIEIIMFFVIGGLTGTLADQERRDRAKVQETAQKLSDVLAQLQASFEQLRRADRLSALGRLSAGLAHEIRNPLGAVEGAIQILRRPELPEATQQEFGELAQREVDRLKGLLADFLGFARPAAPRRLPTDIGTLLESVRLLAAETARMSGARIEVEPPENLPSIAVDPEQIKQVLLNLVLNAVQAMPNGGKVVLKAARKADSIVVSVEDEGIGISPEDLERVFDPFFTKREGGTGLGLSIAYQIVNGHGGHIQAWANPDRGMTFSVTLPLNQEQFPIGPRMAASQAGTGTLSAEGVR